jgi:toxin ParE1/3/4
MGKYVLTNKALHDLTQIWEYSLNVWSEQQADKYYYQLIQAFEKIALNANTGKPYPEIGNGLWGLKAGQHIIFYRILQEEKSMIVEVIRIRHSRMDIKSRLLK